MIGPKIINVVPIDTDPSSDYGMFTSVLVRDGLKTPVAQSEGGAWTTVTGYFGDGINPVDYTGVILFNHNFIFSGIYNDGTMAGYDNDFIDAKYTFETEYQTGYRNTLIAFEKITTDNIFVSAFQSEEGYVEKSLGEIIFFNENDVTLNNGYSTYSETWRQVSKEIILLNGETRTIITPSSDGRNSRYESVGQIDFLNEQQVEALRVLKWNGKPFYFMPEPDVSVSKYFKCYIAGPLNIRYTTHTRSAGYSVNLNIKELG